MADVGSGVSANGPRPQAPEPSPQTSDPIYDCWHRIGVDGNAMCRELVRYIHCRNCPVYSAAGLQLLDRPMPADYRRERAEHYAQAKKTVAPARLSVVIFRLGSEWLALPTTAFQEVAEGIVWPSSPSKPPPSLEGQLGEGGGGGRGPAGHRLHSLPHRRRSLALGLVNVRGELLVCASVARLLGLEMPNEELRNKPQARRPDSAFSISHSAFARLLVTNWNGQRVAFPVDEVFGIQRLAETELRDLPATISKSASTCTQGIFAWRDRTVGLLDTGAFFSTLNRSLA